TAQALKAGHEVIIVSADKDLMQLIRPGVSFYDGMKDKFFTPEDVKEKFGVYPDKVVDVQALAGDKTDNIPGVPGIGLKTASELVNQFGSLQNVLDHADQIPQAKRRELILSHKEDAEISLKLVTLKADVPVTHDLQEFKCCAPKSDNLLNFADKLGFKSIRPKLEQWIQEHSCKDTSVSDNNQQPAPQEVIYKTIKKQRSINELKNKIKESHQIFFQVLYDGTKIAGFSISPMPNEAYYLPLPQNQNTDDLFSFSTQSNDADTDEKTILDFIREIMADTDILKVTADLKTQWHRLQTLYTENIDIFPYDDISVMSYDLDSSEHEHSLSVLAHLILNYELAEPKTSSKVKQIDFTAEEYGSYIYAAADCISKIYNALKERIFKEKKTYVYEMLDRPLIAVLYKMEKNGIKVNEQKLKELDTEFAEKMAITEKEIYNLAGEEFNLNSPKQIGEILYQKLGLKGKKNVSGSFNTSAEVLEQLAEEYEIAAKILEWRSYAKLKSTYTTALLEVRDNTGRVHTTFSQTVVNTGRLASSNPNLQNIPNRNDIGRKIRACFEASPGYKLVSADYSQMELRLMASVVEIKALREAFEHGEDIHSATAARVFNLPPDQVDREHRSRAKAINFGIIYGISQFGLAKQLNISREQAKQYIDSYFAIMPEVKVYMDKTIEFAHQNGCVFTPFGRKCALSGINSSNQRIASFAERAAINAPIQGGAADIVKLAMQQIDYALSQNNLHAKLLLQVHDELILEVREDQVAEVSALLKQVMENVVPTAVKMIVEVGSGLTWDAAH
ncbi:MAG: DNA polymerase I, partial [Alphaproteobacteria bacterium]|nr:DNA polymerase I [Alphaproteobacteria bacterium]